MLHFFSDTKENPLARLIELTEQELNHRKNLEDQHKKSMQEMYRQIALLVNEFYRMICVLERPQEVQNPEHVLKIHVNNFHRFLEDMHISYRVVKKGDVFQEDMKKSFPHFTFKSDSTVEHVLIEKMISPAIYHKDELIKGGELFLLSPAEHSEETHDDDPDKQINTTQENED